MSHIVKRTFKRYKKETPLRLRLKKGVYDCKILDYSANGVCLHILSDTHPLSAGDTVELKVQDPDLDFHGEVVWIKKVNDGFKAGLKRSGDLKGMTGLIL
jgi:hypothetical protein